VMKRSFYTTAALHPMTTLLGVAAIAGIAGMISSRRGD
jgi:hypothetical protein